MNILTRKISLALGHTWTSSRGILLFTLLDKTSLKPPFAEFPMLTQLKTAFFESLAVVHCSDAIKPSSVFLFWPIH